MAQINKEQIKNIAIVVLAVAVIGLAYYVFYGLPSNLSAEQTVQKAVSYINENVLMGKAIAVLNGKTTIESGLYKFNVKVDADEFPSYISKDGKLLFPQVIDISKFQPKNSQNATNSQNSSQSSQTTLGDFVVSQDEICQENSKPIVYFFGSKTCPHCAWEHPIVEKVAKQFEGLISFHNNMDNDKDREVFEKYSPEGYIPNLVIGCKYFRTGSGEVSGEEAEINNLIALLCKITNNQPEGVCGKVQSLIDSVSQ